MPGRGVVGAYFCLSAFFRMQICSQRTARTWARFNVVADSRTSLHTRRNFKNRKGEFTSMRGRASVRGRSPLSSGRSRIQSTDDGGVTNRGTRCEHGKGGHLSGSFFLSDAARSISALSAVTPPLARLALGMIRAELGRRPPKVKHRPATSAQLAV